MPDDHVPPAPDDDANAIAEALSVANVNVTVNSSCVLEIVTPGSRRLRPDQDANASPIVYIIEPSLPGVGGVDLITDPGSRYPPLQCRGTSRLHIQTG
jgi:hypothetical protein